MTTPYNQAYALMEEIYKNFSREDQLTFLREDTLTMHHTLGMHLRNHAKLWENPWEPELIDGVDYSRNHPDAISSQVLRDFQLHARQQDFHKRIQPKDTGAA